MGNAGLAFHKILAAKGYEMTIVFYLAMLAVIVGHFFFAYGQWFKWPDLCDANR